MIKCLFIVKRGDCPRERQAWECDKCLATRVAVPAATLGEFLKMTALDAA